MDLEVELPLCFLQEAFVAGVQLDRDYATGYLNGAKDQRDADQLIVNDLATRFADVRRRVIEDFYTGTSFDACHQAFCIMCERSWPYDEPEQHEMTCPLRKETP